MKRELTYNEIQNLIKQEDDCGINTLLQEILSYTNKEGTVILGKHIKVIGEFNEKNELGKYEVSLIKKEK